MAYCTQADLEAVIGAERLSQLTDFEKTDPGYINATRVTAACEAAASMIDSYAAKHYTVPFPTPSDAIKRIAVRLAIYDLIQGSPVGPTPEQIAEQDARMKWLESLANHKVTPGTTPSPTPHTMVVDKAYDRPSTKAVGREKTKGFW